MVKIDLDGKCVLVTGAAGFIGSNLVMRLLDDVKGASSSVYGTNVKVPYSTDDKVDNPVSLYAATKKSNELMAHAYSKLYDIPATGLRFFTVYGPAGRPDMAYFGFTDRLVRGEDIRIFNYGNCLRDFGFKPSTPLRDGLRTFAEWYRQFYG